MLSVSIYIEGVNEAQGREGLARGHMISGEAKSDCSAHALALASGTGESIREDSLGEGRASAKAEDGALAMGETLNLPLICWVAFNFLFF